MSAGRHILICDDQRIIHETIAVYLKAEGFTYDSAYDGEEALRRANEIIPDLIILDLMMPKINGISVCRKLRETMDVPIIMLTAKGEEVDKILGLELGADDYIVKPFSPRELVARIKTVLRRINSKSGVNELVLRFDGLEINIVTYEVRIKGSLVHFTPKEVAIMYLLVSCHGQVFSREQILQNVWGTDYHGYERSVDTLIKRIRRKLSHKNMKWVIKSIYGVGYKFEASNE